MIPVVVCNYPITQKEPGSITITTRPTSQLVDLVEMRVDTDAAGSETDRRRQVLEAGNGESGIVSGGDRTEPDGWEAGYVLRLCPWAMWRCR